MIASARFAKWVSTDYLCLDLGFEFSCILFAKLLGCFGFGIACGAMCCGPLGVCFFGLVVL